MPKFKAKRIKSTADVFILIYNSLLFTAILLYCISLILPLLWMVITSFKNSIDYSLNLFGLPSKWEFSNYSSILSFLKIRAVTPKGTVEYGIGVMAYNSVVRSAGTAAMVVFITACVTYVMAKYTFKGNNFIYILGIFVMITPIVGNLPSSMMIRKALGIYDNMALFILTSPSVIFGLHFLILYAAYKNISWSYAEAAFIDGAGHYTVMFRIMLPMMLPTCVALFVLNFLAGWNDYQTPMIWLPSYPNLAYGMFRFQSEATAGAQGATGPMILAGFTLIMIPTILLYLFMHRIILSKLNVGGLKG